MDTLAHSIDGGLLILIPTWLLGIIFKISIPLEILIPLIIVFAIMGGFIDLYGEYRARFKNDNYVWYNRAHNGDLVKILKWIPPMGLHIWLDKFGHGAGERWYAGIWYEYFMPWRWREKMWVESLQWFLIILIFLTFIIL